MADKRVITHLYPESWASMFGIETAFNPNIESEMFLTITAYSTPTINYLSTDATKMYNFKGSAPLERIKVFYPKDNIQEQIRHTYGADASKLGEMVGETRTKIYGALAEVSKTTTGGTTGTLFEEPFVYNRPERRVFPINIPLVAYSDLDKDIYNILQFFRKHTYPSKAKPTKGISLINYPSVFKITGGLFDRCNGLDSNGQNDSFFVITDVDIDYNADLKFFASGLPMQANLTLNVTELNLRFSEDFSKKRVSTSISTRGDVENVAQFNVEQGGALKKVLNGKIPGMDSAKSGMNPFVQKHLNDMVLKTPTIRWAKQVAADPTGFAKNIAKEELGKIIKGSKLYKTITMFTQVTPIHLLEVRAMLKKIRG